MNPTDLFVVWNKIFKGKRRFLRFLSSIIYDIIIIDFFFLMIQEKENEG